MRAGDVAPDFELPDQHGTPRRLSDLLINGPVVLFFFPAAMTPGCTTENRHFRDLGPAFAATGAQRVGVSPDPVSKQHEFASRDGLDFVLLADADGAVATAYGVRRRLFGPIKRVTFVIDTSRRIRKVIASELRMGVHADRALEALQQTEPT